jgi:hypothetical protein
MTVLDRTPSNTGYLQPTKYQLVFPKMNNLTFFCQNINIPGVSIGTLEQATPFLNITRPGNKISYEDLTITFIVDESLNSWQEVHNWIRGMADPKSFPTRDPKTNYSDAILTVFTNLNNPQLSYQFVNTYPYSLSGLNLDTTESADNMITATATFKFDYYDIIKAT